MDIFQIVKVLLLDRPIGCMSKHKQIWDNTMTMQPDQDSKIADTELPEKGLKALLLSASARAELDPQARGMFKRRGSSPL